MKLKLAAEPLVVRAAIVAAITGIIHALVVLGVLPITPDQEDAIASAVDLAGAAIAVVWSRSAVSPARTYEPRHSDTEEPSEAVSVDESAPVEDVESEGASA
jgi:hypothetical protein